MSDYTRNTKEELLSILTEKQEKLYASGLEDRPTMMAKIEEIEANYRNQMRVLAEECQTITGRPLSYYPPVSPLQS